MYEGIFHTLHIDGDNKAHAMLKYAKLIRDPNLSKADEKGAMAEKPQKTLVVDFATLGQIIARDVRLNPEDLATEDFGFDTDASIGRGRGG